MGILILESPDTSINIILKFLNLWSPLQLKKWTLLKQEFSYNIFRKVHLSETINFNLNKNFKITKHTFSKL